MRFLGNKELLAELTHKASELEVHKRGSLAVLTHYRFTKAVSGALLLYIFLRESFSTHFLVCGVLTSLYFVVMKLLRAAEQRAARKEITEFKHIREVSAPWCHIALAYEEGELEASLLLAQVLLFRERLEEERELRKKRAADKKALLDQTQKHLGWMINTAKLESRALLVQICTECNESMSIIAKMEKQLEQIAERYTVALHKAQTILAGIGVFKDLDPELHPIPFELTPQWVRGHLEGALDTLKTELIEWDCTLESLPPLRPDKDLVRKQ